MTFVEGSCDRPIDLEQQCGICAALRCTADWVGLGHVTVCRDLTTTTISIGYDERNRRTHKSPSASFSVPHVDPETLCVRSLEA
jgi:hypothetical protein